MGAQYRDYLVEPIGDGAPGSVDLCAYVFLRVRDLLRSGGQFGMLATNTIAWGNTREVGLDQLVQMDHTIPCAVTSPEWPGAANPEVFHVWVHRGKRNPVYSLDEQPVQGITPSLCPPGKVQGTPYCLVAHLRRSFIHPYVLGLGVVLSPEEAHALIEKDLCNRDVLFPYLNGEDLNSRPDHLPSRWVINFPDWPSEQPEEYSDFWRIVDERVKPERQRRKLDSSYALRKPLPERYWRYGEERPALYKTIA